MNKRRLGFDYEQKAKSYIEARGATVIDMNYHFHKMGEIDIIYYDYDKDTCYLCFGEVKYRSNTICGNALEAVTLNKMRQISKVALGYIKEKRIPFDHPMRFDVIAINDSDINWIKNAFYYTN